MQTNNLMTLAQYTQQNPQAVVGGSTGGERSRGRPRTEWMTNITEWTGMSYEDLVRLAQDREPWRIMTANLLKEDGT